MHTLWPLMLFLCRDRVSLLCVFFLFYGCFPFSVSEISEMKIYSCTFVGKKYTEKSELNAKREQILPFMYSIFNLISHSIFMMNNKVCWCFFLYNLLKSVNFVQVRISSEKKINILGSAEIFWVFMRVKTLFWAKFLFDYQTKI